MIDVTRQVEPFDAEALRAHRSKLGWSQAHLAAEVGVSPRQIANYESGQHAPSPARLAKLASVLAIPARVLGGVESGDESLADLRRFAGLDRAQATSLLALRLGGTTSGAYLWQLTAIEAGREVLAWKSPQILATVIASLADIYVAPPAAVRRAWCRAFPAQTALLDPPPPQAEEVVASRQTVAESEWQDLNDRQRAYLVVIFREDQKREGDVRLSQLASKKLGAASDWRKIPFTIHADPAFTGYTEIQTRLRTSGDLDAGAGATLQALARRDLLVISIDQVEVAPLGFVPRTLVELTRHGRAAVRAGLHEPIPRRRPAHLLSEWLWRCLAMVAQTGDKGLPTDRLQGKARFYLGTGYRPQGRPSRGYIDLVAMPQSADSGSYVAERCWKLTDSGREHVTSYLATYQSLYPAVELDMLRH
jgi:transcriptional regulator with XRE-family HTH domain